MLGCSWDAGVLARCQLIVGCCGASGMLFAGCWGGHGRSGGLWDNEVFGCRSLVAGCGGEEWISWDCGRIGLNMVGLHW